MDDEKRSARETDGDSDVEDLDVTGEGAAEKVKGGGTRVQGNPRWVDEAAQPTQQ